MKALITFVWAGIISLTALASDLPPVPFVLTSGSVDGEMKPDTVTITFSLKTFAETSEKGLNEFVMKSGEVIAILERYKIAKEQIEAWELYKDIVRQRASGNEVETKIIGYDYSRKYFVKLNDLSMYSSLVTALFSFDGIYSLYSSFDSTEREVHEKELIRKAMEKAKKKAEELALIAGSEVISVYAISETDFARLGAKFLLSGYGASDAMSMGTSSKKLEDLLVIPSKIETSASINVIFKIK